MKKHLLSTSVIALGVAAAAPASAQEWNLNWGGFLSSFVAIVDSEDALDDGADLDGLRLFNTGEIQFTPSVTLDNGLTFGANVQFEAQNSPNFSIETANGGAGGNNIIDESYVEVSSDTFGRLVVGTENSAGYLLSTGAPVVGGFFVNSPSYSAFLPVSGNFALLRAPGSSSFSEVSRNNDIARITYYTPSFNGLTVGFSYAPNNNGNGQATNGFSTGSNSIVADSSTASLEDIWDVGINYSQSFGDWGVRLSARYGEGDAQETVQTLTGPGADGINGNADDDELEVVTPAGRDAEVWQVGASFDYLGWTVGGSYGESENISGADNGEQEGWSLGVSYDVPGPWTVGFETYQGEQSDGVVDTSDLEVYKLAASREVGPGVSWDVFVTYVQATDETDPTGDSDVGGTIFGTAINLSF